MDSVKIVLDSALFAAEKHKFQKRKDPEGTPYINHPLGVASILLNEGGVSDPEVLAAAILHDTVEDTDTTEEELTRQFGVPITKIVMECTDDKTLSKAERKRLQVESCPHKSVKARLVKMADKIYNLRDLNRVKPQGWSDERVHEYFEWAQKVTNGCRGLNTKLEGILDEMYEKRLGKQ